MYTNKPKMKSQRNVANSKNKKNAIDINITQTMVGKQWVKRWGMYRWGGEASILVKKASFN